MSNKNQQKFLSYKEAWRRIERSIGKGFPIEAVSLCESIISDRLLSFLSGVNPDGRYKVSDSFQKLISSSSALIKASKLDGSELMGRVEQWRKSRNEVIHGMVKSHPGQPTSDVKIFIKHAKEVAEQGAKLAREVCNWHKRQVKASKSKAV